MQPIGSKTVFKTFISRWNRGVWRGTCRDALYRSGLSFGIGIPRCITPLSGPIWTGPQVVINGKSWHGGIREIGKRGFKYHLDGGQMGACDPGDLWFCCLLYTSDA